MSMTPTSKARLQALGWAFLTGSILTAYDTLQAAQQVGWKRALGLALIGGLGGAALYLKQRPREVWSPERRQAVRAAEIVKIEEKIQVLAERQDQEPPITPPVLKPPSQP